MNKLRLIWINRVYSKNFITDFLQRMKNIIGGRLKAYEKMIDECMQTTWDEFYKKYPDAKNIKCDIEHFTTGAVIIMITGEIEDGTK